MERVTNTRIYMSATNGNFRPLFFASFFSLILHIIFFALVVGIPRNPRPRVSLPRVVNVDLVSLPGKAGPVVKTTPKRKTPVKKTTVPEIKKNIPKLKKPAVPVEVKPSKLNIPPKPMIKTSLKKKTFKPENVLKNAVSRLEKKVEEERPPKVNEAIDRLKATVENRNKVDEAIEKIENKVAKQGTGEGKSGTGGTGKSGMGEGTLLLVYRVEIADRISRNWVFSEQIAGGRSDLIALVAFDIMPDGEIRDVIFTQRSGNRYFDESAIRAIQKSNPTLPHPPGIKRNVIKMGLRFTPQGIR